MTTTFADLGLTSALLAAVTEVGYEAPTPIQALTIPALLAGRDVIGQAQTGTGKTAAFALPILQQLDLALAEVQALVLTPTRELAIQVAEAIHTYGKALGAVRVLPVYGGQGMHLQVKHLRAGVHVVVGTPGRVMDHLRRETLTLEALRIVVLDEGDEMLRMGFIDDVEWILGQMRAERQTALFSATMPPAIRKIAARHLRNPETIAIETKTLTVPTVEQRYLNVSERQKLDALTRVLEVEAPEAALVFVRTKLAAAQVAERLQARGYAVEAMHGDMTQKDREAVIRRLRDGQVEVVIATDVAARGLDVERISHVINHDVPFDAEGYLHRIGRTGRAGRAGTAILFVTPRETRLLKTIERFTGQRIAPMRMPTAEDVAARRVQSFKARLRAAVSEDGLEPYLALVEELSEEAGLDMAELAAAAARLAAGDRPLTVEALPAAPPEPVASGRMIRLFVDAGREAGIRPGDIVGAIAGETDIPGRVIGAIDVHARFTFVDIPAEYVDRVLERMRNVQIRSTPIVVKLATPQDERADRRGDRADRRGGDHADRPSGHPTRGKGAPRPKRPKGRHAA
ncbi:MAG TPA: DEAD/DEAH box helicase [Candidatus Acidoferrum sp.]|nr:DEAD/DEAH box helicase [Candidatus Acidoferrum sp.]